MVSEFKWFGMKSELYFINIGYRLMIFSITLLKMERIEIERLLSGVFFQSLVWHGRWQVIDHSSIIELLKFQPSQRLFPIKFWKNLLSLLYTNFYLMDSKRDNNIQGKDSPLHLAKGERKERPRWAPNVK